ncbi:CRISPR-associated helicase Cas3' [Solimonas sp. K1W22B-7]|uniref:CRISPR-associated helicase Cas3' n=1 Tax=Solimonas sp. K1W22B-7 TaxID=2303331 RepID=UPI000E331F75|nr:CRISPR-associated helicase Cas3' [Solimonas sp. K1W22B-7]AXQ28790.1 CRISPR-associated helicase Cas3' [Solimonas sp. K1W22B-7]
MSTADRFLWAKTRDEGGGAPCWHPLLLHLLDVAACADAILAREPEETRQRMARSLGLEWSAARPWLLLLIACHDLGKGCPGFQCKWQNLSGLDSGPDPDTTVNHAFVSQVELFELLLNLGWPENLAELAADAIGCHHGERASPTTLRTIEDNAFSRTLGKPEWRKARHAIFDALLAAFDPGGPPTKAALTGPDFMLLAGLTSFADWLGSNEVFFSFGLPEDCGDLAGWFQSRRSENAEEALDGIGWAARLPLAASHQSFAETFGFAPRPLQSAVAQALATLQGPAILLIEAPMGEGKTEAAFYAYLELQRRFGHRGLYIALPTKATGNAMFRRTLRFLRGQRCERPLDLQLLHGGAMLEDSYQRIKSPTGIHDPQSPGDVRAGEWFTHKKRALLSEYGVGTIDQALLTILPVRHQFVRLWGLANRVVVFDEIHAYDAYTGTLLLHLLRWLMALGASVLLLSATLPPQMRRKLAELTNSQLPQTEAAYPRLTVYEPTQAVRQYAFAADPLRRLNVRLEPVAADLEVLRAALGAHIVNGGYALALVNTVQRAQRLFRLYGDGEALRVGEQSVGKRLADGTEVYLFHARFPADQRQRREDAVMHIFGPPEPSAAATRSGRKLLIATQVAEQSLDLDFDVIATDLAPVDLLLQRAGRLWRHQRASRPLAAPVLIVAGLAGDVPPLFGEPLWWGAVYREDVLLRTWCLLHGLPEIDLPEDIDSLVSLVYAEGDELAVPSSLTARLEKAKLESDGVVLAYKQQAHQAVIGRPDTGEWNDPARFTLYDEDEPGIHRSLMAKTRLGEDSVVVIPLWEIDAFDLAAEPDFARAKGWFLRAMSLSRRGIVKNLRAEGVPTGWRKSSLLRNAYPLLLDAQSRWINDARVRMNDDLGLVYDNEEPE